MRRMLRMLSGAVATVVVAVVAGSGCTDAEQKAAPSVAPVKAPAAAASAAEAASTADVTPPRPVQASSGDAPLHSEDPLVSISSEAGSPPPIDPPLQGRTSETSVPRDSATTAGPAVSYTDQTDDASGVGSNAALSQPAFDIVQVRWAPASEVDPQRLGYSSAITLAGVAANDGTYVTYGEFQSDVPGERCELYHFLTPGSTAFANAFCGTVEDRTRRLVGRMQGSQVTSTRNSVGGTVLVATFSDSGLPPELEAGGRMLFRLSAYACPGSPHALPNGCWTAQPSDWANSWRSYHL